MAQSKRNAAKDKKAKTEILPADRGSALPEAASETT